MQSTSSPAGGLVYAATGPLGQPILMTTQQQQQHPTATVPFATTPNGGIQFLTQVIPQQQQQQQMQQQQHSPAGLHQMASSTPGNSLVMSSTPHLQATTSAANGGGLVFHQQHPTSIVVPMSSASAAGGVAAAASPSSASSSALPPAATFRNLKVGGLPSDAGDADLYTIFEPFGKIESAKVMLNVHTCESRGYGFVLFSSQEAGCRAFGEMNGKNITLRGSSFTLDIKSSEWDGRQAAIETNAIYVRNIPASVTEDEIRSVFSTFGQIVSMTSRIQQQLGSAGSSQVLLPPTVTVGGATPPVPNNASFSVGGASPGGTTADPLLMMGTSVDSLGGSLNIAMMQAASALNGVGVLGAGGDPLTKLAMIEFTTIDAARKAVSETHRKHYFPTSGGIPVLSKFADPPHLKESRRQLKKQQQSQQQQQATLATVVSVGNNGGGMPTMIGGTSLPNNSNANVLYGVGGGQTPMQQQQQSKYFTPHGPMVGHHAGLPPLPYGHHQQHGQQQLPPPPPPPPSSSVHPQLLFTSSSSMAPYNTATHAPPPPPPHVRFPDAVPLPLAPRSGFQRIFYQGILGITPDGLLYPIKPEMCMYHTTPPPSSSVVSGSVASTSASLFSSTTVAGLQQQPTVSQQGAALGSSVNVSVMRGDDVAGSLGAVGESTNAAAVLQQLPAAHSLWGDLAATSGVTNGGGVSSSSGVQPPVQQSSQLQFFPQQQQPQQQQQQQQPITVVAAGGGGYYMLPATHYPQHQQATSGGIVNNVQDVET